MTETGSPMERDKRSRWDALLSEASDDARKTVAKTFAREFADGRFSSTEVERAVIVLERLANDVAADVRRMVSEQLQSCGLLPRDLAIRMAEDIGSVAVPLLQHSPVLTDEDLLAVIAAGDTDKQRAIAGRNSVSETVSGALVDTHEQSVVQTLLANNGAAISQASLNTVLDDFDGSETVQELLIGRPSLPLRTVEKLICVVSDRLRDRIVTEHNFPRHIAEQIAVQGREAAIIGRVGSETGIDEIDDLVAQLHAQGKLTPTLILRALCQGDLHFYDAAMAALAEMPRDKAQQLLHQRGAGGLRMVFRKTGLPESLFPAMKAVSSIAKDFMERAEQETLDVGYTNAAVDRLVSEYDHVSPGNLDHVLSQVSRKLASR